VNLENWIKTATENLVPKAAVKVCEDISMHVETAVNRYQLEHHSELEALELAVNDLGDAKIAARGFEKTYLTLQEHEAFVTEKKGLQINCGLDLYGLFYLLLVYIIILSQILFLNHFQFIQFKIHGV
jgi:hypothetical protein